MDYRKDLQRTLARMLAERERLDQDIAGLQALLDRTAPTAPGREVRRTRRNTQSSNAILDIMRDGGVHTAPELSARVDLNRNAVSASLHRMKNAGEVVSVGHGKFRIATAPPDPTL